MAWGVFTFSKDGRQQVAAVLRGLLIAQLVVSLCMVIFCYNTSLRVMLLLRHIHKVANPIIGLGSSASILPVRTVRTKNVRSACAVCDITILKQSHSVAP